MTVTQENPMQGLKITVGPFAFTARLLLDEAPQTCAAFLARLPFKTRIVHVRWSGEAVWSPLGDYDFGVGPENATSHPSRGDILLHPARLSESEILIAYGACRFASKVGQLAGNHFLVVEEGLENLRALGELCLWKGAQDIVFERC
jgi:hypothetical protein